MTGELQGKNEPLLPDPVEEKREIAYRMYCQGVSLRKIGIAIGLSKTRSWELVDEALQEKREDLKAQTDEVRARELARLENLHSETWEAYNKSKAEHQETETRQEKGKAGRGSSDKTSARVKKSQRDGDPRLLKIILEVRCQIQLLRGLTKNADLGDEVPVQILRSDKNYNPADDV